MESKRLECTDCGHSNPPNWIACANCGKELTSNVKANAHQNSTTSRTPQPATRPASNTSTSGNSGCMGGYSQGFGFGCGCLTFVFLLWIAIGYLGSAISNPEVERSPTTTTSSGARVSLNDFNQIQTGMTYAQVQGVIGSAGIESSRNEIPGTLTVAYSWKNDDGSNMIAIFQNDSMVQKSQAGLE